VRKQSSRKRLRLVTSPNMGIPGPLQRSPDVSKDAEALVLFARNINKNFA